MQLIQDVRAGEHEDDFTGTPYIPVYVMLAVSVFASLFLFLIRYSASNVFMWKYHLCMYSYTNIEDFDCCF